MKANLTCGEPIIAPAKDQAEVQVAALEGIRLLPVRILAAMPPPHRLARWATIDVSDLKDEPVLLLRQGFGTRLAASWRGAHQRCRARRG